MSNDLQRLVGNVKDIQFNLDGIAKVAVSPRREMTENKAENEGEKTPKNRSISLSAADTTPPVRDSGPGETTVVQAKSKNETVSKSKLDQVFDIYPCTILSVCF
jgi:hypothetical protein